MGVIEETHIFTPNIVNQFKYGYARLQRPDLRRWYETSGVLNKHHGHLQTCLRGATRDAFPITNFAGIASAPTNWAGNGPGACPSPKNYTLLDNVQMGT